MRTISRVVAVLLALIPALATAAYVPTGFFPLRPAHAKLVRLDGVLTGFGGGTGSGFVRLRLDNGTVRLFNISQNIRIDGIDTICAHPPRLGYVPSKFDCLRWPAYIFVGSTRVRVTAWKTTRDGSSVYVTDRVDYIDTAMYHGTLPED